MSKETTLFEDLERIQNKQEQEDLKVLEESEDDKINKTQVDFIDDGKIDYDSKSPLNFKIGNVAKHVNLKAEDLDRFSDIYEELYNLALSQSVYHKSLQDQIKQKGNKVEVNKAFADWSKMLDNVSNLKMLSFICDIVGINESIKSQIMTKEVEKLFGTQSINPITKKDTTQQEILGQLQQISHRLRKG